MFLRNLQIFFPKDRQFVTQSFSALFQKRLQCSLISFAHWDFFCLFSQTLCIFHMQGRWCMCLCIRLWVPDFINPCAFKSVLIHWVHCKSHVYVFLSFNSTPFCLVRCDKSFKSAKTIKNCLDQIIREDTAYNQLLYKFFGEKLLTLVLLLVIVFCLLFWVKSKMISQIY